MDLDLLLDSNSLFDKELVNVTSMVSLELDDCSPLRVLMDRSVAAPGFLERFRNLLTV